MHRGVDEIDTSQSQPVPMTKHVEAAALILGQLIRAREWEVEAAVEAFKNLGPIIRPKVADFKSGSDLAAQVIFNHLNEPMPMPSDLFDPVVADSSGNNYSLELYVTETTDKENTHAISDTHEKKSTETISTGNHEEESTNDMIIATTGENSMEGEKSEEDQHRSLTTIEGAGGIDWVVEDVEPMQQEQNVLLNREMGATAWV